MDYFCGILLFRFIGFFRHGFRDFLFFSFICFFHSIVFFIYSFRCIFFIYSFRCIFFIYSFRCVIFNYFFVRIGFLVYFFGRIGFLTFLRILCFYLFFSGFKLLSLRLYSFRLLRFGLFIVNLYSFRFLYFNFTLARLFGFRFRNFSFIIFLFVFRFLYFRLPHCFLNKALRLIFIDSTLVGILLKRFFLFVLRFLNRMNRICRKTQVQK